MKNLLLISLVLAGFTVSVFAQTEITIKKKTSFDFPGMKMMPAATKAEMDATMGKPSTVYIKGSRMRTDMVAMRKKMSGREKITFTTILQCDKQRIVQFNTKKKKFYQEPITGETSAIVKNAKKGGYVTVSGNVTDTGEQAKLFGYDAKHLKQSITITPGPNACQKSKMSMEIEGWYADIPGFSCPIKRQRSEFQMDDKCFDDVDFQMNGAITGIALKEIKKMTMDGYTITLTEEAIELTKNPIADSLFEPPADYKAANTYKEVADDSPDDSTSAKTTTPSPTPTTVPNGNTSTTFAPPSAGLEKPPTEAKKEGMIRVGIVKPKVSTPNSKPNPDAGADIGDGVSKTLLESLKAENIEAIELTSDAPESEAKEKGCNYIFYSYVTQKRGGGMFGKMMIGAVSAASMMIPGVGAMVGATVAQQVMSKTMGKESKAKDEFTFDYKVFGTDNSVLRQGTSKNKSEKDGDDVLSPQIKTASTAVLADILKKK